MPIKKHDFVEIDYTGRIKEGNEVFDTTNEAIAKKSNIYAKGVEYKPVVICVGEHQLLPGLDEFLVGKDVGSFTVEVPQEKAFGKKDAGLLKMIPANKFEEQGIKPVAGLRLNIDGMVGIIRSVSGGRTVVDFNHPLAGRDVVYDLTVNKFVTDKKVQVESVLKVLLGLKTEVKVENKKATIMMPELPKEILGELSKKLTELTGLDIEYDLKKMPAQSHGDTCNDPAHQH